MFSDQTQKFGGNLNTLLASCIVPEAGVEAGYLSWNSETLKKLISDSIAQGSRYVSFRLREKTSVKDKAGKGAIVRFHSKENLSGFTPKLIVESKEMKHLYAKMIYVDGKGIDAFGKSCFRYMVHLPCMLQRWFKVGFNRAARIMDQLAEAGVVGEEAGTKPREIRMTLEEFERYLDEYV